MKAEFWIVLAILAAANVWDWWKFRIPNVLAFSAVFAGFVFSFWNAGWEGLWISFLSVALAFAVFFIPWAVFGMGAGDVKLLMAVASFLGMGAAVKIGFLAVLAAAFAFLFFIPPKRTLGLLKDAFYLIFYKIPLSLEKPGKKIPFSFPILLAFLYFNLF